MGNMLFGLAFGLIFGFMLTMTLILNPELDRYKALEQEIVDRGHGTWEVQFNKQTKYQTIKFVWKQP